MMPKPKKPLKDPNAKSPIQKFFGGKIPHYLAVLAFLYVLVDGGSSFLNRNAEKKGRKEIQEYINKTISERLTEVLPDTTGNVLRQYLPKEKK